MRPTVLIVALAASAWFVIGIRQARDIATASSIVEAGQSAGRSELAAAAEMLHSAAFLNPDQEVNILRGRLAIARGQLSRARQILGTVVREEPLNLEAWIWFTAVYLGDLREGRIGAARIAQLDPIDARRLRR